MEGAGETGELRHEEVLGRVVEGEDVVCAELVAVGEVFGLEKAEDVEAIFNGDAALGVEGYLSRVRKCKIGEWASVLRKDGTVLPIPFKRKGSPVGSTACRYNGTFESSYHRMATLDLGSTYIADRVVDCCSKDKVPIVALIQRSGTGKTHSALQIAQLEKYRDVSVVVIQLGKAGGDTEILGSLLKMDKGDLVRFAKNCVNIALESKQEDPFCVQKQALDATREGRVLENRPSFEIRSVVVYLDEITNLTREHADVFRNLRAGFIMALKNKHKIKKAIVLTDTDAAISDLLSHKRQGNGTSLEDLEYSVERFCLLPPAILGFQRLKGAILRNMRSRGVLVRPQEAEVLATFLHGPPLWVTTFFEGFSLGICIGEMLYDVFERVLNQKIGTSLVCGDTGDRSNLCHILVYILMSNCMGHPNAINEQYLTRSGPFEVISHGVSEGCGKPSDVISPEEMKRAVVLAPIAEPLTAAACMEVIAEKIGDKEFVKLMQEALRDILMTKYSRTDEDARGSLFEYEFSFHLLLGYVYKNKDHFLGLERSSAWDRIVSVEQLFPETSFCACLEGLKAVCEIFDTEVELHTYGDGDRPVRISCVEAWPSVRQHVIGIQPRGTPGYDVRVGGVFIEIKDDRAALSRDLRAKFRDCKDGTRCFVFRGPGRRGGGKIGDDHYLARRFMDGEDKSRVPHFFVRYCGRESKGGETEGLFNVLLKGCTDSFERMCLDEARTNLIVRNSHNDSLDFLPGWKRTVARILVPELEGIQTSCSEGCGEVVGERGEDAGNEVFLLSRDGNYADKDQMKLVKDIKDLRAPMGVYIPGKVEKGKGRELLEWFLEHDYNPNGLVVFGKGWERDDRDLLEVLRPALSDVHLSLKRLPKD